MRMLQCQDAHCVNAMPSLEPLWAKNIMDQRFRRKTRHSLTAQSLLRMLFGHFRPYGVSQANTGPLFLTICTGKNRLSSQGRFELPARTPCAALMMERFIGTRRAKRESFLFLDRPTVWSQDPGLVRKYANSLQARESLAAVSGQWDDISKHHTNCQLRIPA